MTKIERFEDIKAWQEARADYVREKRYISRRRSVEIQWRFIEIEGLVD